MSIKYEKYSEKSYVVRGDLLDDSVKRKELTKQLQGNCIWNTRLKGGSGLLVSINDHNKNILEKMESISPPVEDKEDKKDTPEDSHSEKKSRKHSLSSSSDEDEEVVRKTSKPRRGVRKDTPVSTDTESDSDDNNQKRRSPKTKNSARRSVRSDSSYDSRSSRKESNKYHRSRSPVSSSDSEDSSEDERIQHTIRRKKNNRNSEKEILEGELFSDNEDTVTLSRRLRGILKRLERLEK